MAKAVRLPKLGQTMEEGTIVNCRVHIGDEVKRGDILFEVETDKAILEMESPAAGFVKYILAESGQTLAVGEAVLILADKDEEVLPGFVDSLKEGASAAETLPVAPVAKPARPQTQPADRVIASPRARRVARQLGVNLAMVTGTGAGGRITEQDVKKAVPSKPAQPAGPVGAAHKAKLGETIPVNKLQRITAQRMLQSTREIPCFYLTVTVDVTELVALRTQLNQTSQVKLSYTDFLIRAVAISMERFPIMAGRWAGETIRLADRIGIGLAIAVPDGLVAPVVKEVQNKDIIQISRDSKVLIEKARNHRLAPADLEGGCITISNLGAFGIASFIPVVVPGQCSILGVGQITDSCVPDHGNIRIRKVMNMTLAVDHRIANGVYAAQFLDSVRRVLEETSNLA